MSHPNLAKMLATTQETQKRRKTQECKVRRLRIIRNKLSTVQLSRLDLIFTEAKWLYNSILEAGVFDYKYSLHGVHSLNKTTGEITSRELSVLHSHVKQNIYKQMKANVKTLTTLKKQGQRVGYLRFRSSVNTVEYSTGDVKWDGASKLWIPKIGWLRASGTKQLKNTELANVRLTRKAGQYYLLVTCYELKQEKSKTWVDGTAVGLDMGVRTHVTFSDGSVWNSMVRETERHRRLQRKLSRQVKGSNNYAKTRQKIQREYGKLGWKKQEQAQKLVNKLVSEHELVFLQDESLRGWKPRYGRRLQHSSLGLVKAKLLASERAVVLDKWTPTTQWCPSCGSLNKHELSERVYSCACGYTAARDEHAAKNMVRIGLKMLPLEQRNTLVEEMSDKISFIEAGLQFPVKQATDRMKPEAKAQARAKVSESFAQR